MKAKRAGTEWTSSVDRVNDQRIALSSLKLFAAGLVINALLSDDNAGAKVIDRTRIHNSHEDGASYERQTDP
jgi:hypothetical protein